MSVNDSSRPSIDDRLSRLAPDLAVTTTIQSGGGECVLVLATR